MTELTPQQIAFIATSGDEDSIALDARAGTGKTFSLAKWGSKSRRGGLATSFSRSTVQELGKSMPNKFESTTLHALGRKAIINSGKYSELNGSKIFDITKLYCDEQDISFEAQAPVRKLVSLAKTFGIQPNPKGPEGLVEDTYDAWESLAEQYDIEMTPEVYETSRAVLEISNVSAVKDGIIDFDDMLYIALLWPHRFPRFPIILADEVQDFSNLQHHMVFRCLLPDGRVTAAGDDRQAIYAFRGALTDSYLQMVKKFNMRRLPLTVSFRCPRAVVLEAQKYVPDIESAPGAIEGAVIWPEKLALDEVPKAILCRNNAPLIRLALSLLVSGRTVEVAGQDIGRGLISLTKRITKRNLPADDFFGRLETWKEREVTKFPKRKSRILDKFLALKALTRHHKDVKAIQDHLLKLYPNPASRDYRPAEVHLTTIHRAKGLEWSRVLFLDPQLLPSKFAKQEFELVQEDNLAYVGITRAKEELVYCASDNIEGLEKE